MTWDAHAAFMDALVAEDFVLVGGPLGDGDGDRVLLCVSARDEAAIRTRLATDPWHALDLLAIERIEPWELLLGPF